MVRLPSSRGIGFLVRRRRSDEHAHVLDAAVAGLVEGEPGILVELLPPGGRPVLPVDLRFVVVWQLTGSRWGALIALMLLGINPTFSAAYFDTGNIYDVLAYMFFWGAFALYVHSRQAGRPLGWGRLALVFGLFVAALDAKEIAVSLPVAVGLYELVWHPPANWKLAELGGWIRQEGRFALIGGLADIAYIVGKKYGPHSLWLVGPYQPHYSVAAVS